MKDNPVSEKTWDEIEKEIFTPEEIEESNKRVAEICKMIQERDRSRHRKEMILCLFYRVYK